LSYLNEQQSKAAIKREGFDIFHPTYYNAYYGPLNIKKPIVLTCYDLIHEKYVQSDTKLLSIKKKSIDLASKIIAISQHTKNDLIEYYKIPESKVEVIYLASSLQSEKPKTHSALNANYFLFVGNRNRYKNFTLLVEAIASLLLSEKLNLFCAGGGQFSKEEHSLFNKLKIADRIHIHSASDQSLINLYSNAIAFIYPSLYEGFGIPLLEAMGCGCPVMASDKSSLPEIAADAALYFDPLDKDSILYCAEKLFNDLSLRASLVKKGYERQKMFSWESTAIKTQNLYHSLSQR
jgi:glycosyltransferase involved in cell wall biosynthesis